MDDGKKGGLEMRPEQGRRTPQGERRSAGSANNRNYKSSRNPRRRVRRPNEVAKRRRRRKFNEALGKIIPVFVAVVLIAVVVTGFYGSKLLERYKYSNDEADLNEYFGIYHDYQVAMVINNTKVEEKAVYYKNAYYLSQDDTKKYFTNHFYVNIDEQMALYTTQDEIIRADLNQPSDFCYYKGDEKRELNCAPVITNDGKTYFSIDFLKLFVDFNIEKYDEPRHLVIYTEDKTLDKAVISKDTNVRYRGGVKSDILKAVSEGDTVYVLEEMEDWAKVQTTDGFIGYVEIKRYDKAGSAPITIEKCEIPLEYTPITFDGKINMAFHQLFDASGSDFSDVPKDAGINVVAPTVFRITDDEGSIKSIVNSNYVNNAHNAGVKVWGVWTDVDNDVNMSSMLHTFDSRSTLINNIVSLTTENNLDGINLDFEKIPSDSGSDWAEFLKELSVKTHQAGLVLSVDNYAPTASTVHYNRGVQGKVCDYVVVMGYDEHWASGGVAGSVASIGFVQDGIANTISSGVPAEKLINAVPFYTRVWKTKDGNVTADTMGMGSSADWCAKNGVELNWNDETCQKYGEKEMGGTLYQVWLEDYESLEAKLSVMEAQNVAGVAEWKLGLETSDAWSAILNYLGK